MPFTLFTSIPPEMSRIVRGQERGPAWQSACIQSWIRAGFRVISLNPQNEIDRFHPLPANIEFQALPAHSSRASISDFFRAAQACGDEVAGIVNADCMIAAPPEFLFRLKSCIGGIVLSERADIDPNTLRPLGLSGFGFDGFFFDVAAIDKIKWDDHWMIGAVWYDFWLPLAFQVGGLRVKTLPAPILHHLYHDRAWNWEVWAAQFMRIVHFIQDNDGLDPQLAQAMKGTTSDMIDRIHELSHLVYRSLASSEPLWSPAAASVDELTAQMLWANATPAPLPQPAPSRNLFRAALSRAIDRAGLRYTFYVLGLVDRPTND